MSFMLGCLQQKVMAKFYGNSKKKKKNGRILGLYQTGENFHEQYFSVIIPILDFYRCARFQQKNKEQVPRRTGYRHMDGWMNKWMDR